MRRYKMLIMLAGLLLPVILSVQGASANNSIFWECLDRTKWASAHSYQLGAFLHFGHGHSIRIQAWEDVFRNPEKTWNASVAVSLVPYIVSRQDSNIKYLLLPNKGRNYFLACGSWAQQLEAMKPVADRYPSIVLRPEPEGETLTSARRKELQRALHNYLNQSENREFIPLTAFDRQAISTMPDLLRNIAEKMQQGQVPFLAQWQDGEVYFENFAEITRFYHTPQPQTALGSSPATSADQGAAAETEAAQDLTAETEEQPTCQTCLINIITWRSDLGLALIGNNCVKLEELDESGGYTRFGCTRDQSKEIRLTFRKEGIDNDLLLPISATTLNAYWEDSQKAYEITQNMIERPSQPTEIPATTGVPTQSPVMEAPATAPASPPVLPTETQAQPPSEIPVKLILPRIFEQMNDMSGNIQLGLPGECQQFQRIETTPYIYTSTCTQAPTQATKLRIKNFTGPEKGEVIPITVEVSQADGVIDVVPEPGMKAQFALLLPEYVGMPYYHKSGDRLIPIQPGEPLSLLTPLVEDFSRTLEFQVTEGKRSSVLGFGKEPEWVCDFPHKLTVQELGTTVTLHPPCRRNVLSFKTGIPFPENGEPCINGITIENGKLSCLRETGKDLTLTWKKGDKLLPKLIQADQLDNTLEFPVTLVTSSITVIRVIFPEPFHNMPDIAERITIAGCENVQATDSTSIYQADCPRNAAISSLEIRDFAQFPLIPAANPQEYQIDVSKVTVSAEVVLAAGTEISYSAPDMQGNLIAISPGMPYTYRIILTSPTVRLQTQNEQYRACDITASVDITKLLRGEAIELQTPCQMERIVWTPQPTTPLQPEVTGCVGLPVFTAEGFTCVRRNDGGDVQIHWGSGEKPTVLTAAELNQNASHTVNPPGPRFPVTIAADSSVPYEISAKLIAFGSEAECQSANLENIKENVVLYTATTVGALRTRATDWLVAARGSQRISKCVQGELQGDTLVYEIEANKFAGRRQLIVIENSRYLAQAGWGRPLQDGVFAWFQELKNSGTQVPVTLLRIQGSGEVQELLRAEELEQLTIQDTDPAAPSVYARIYPNLHFGDEGFQPLKHLDNIALRFPIEELGSILYVTDSRGVPQPLAASQVGTLLDWNVQGVRVTVLTPHLCDKWRFRDQALARCQTFGENPTGDNVKTVVQQWINQ